MDVKFLKVNKRHRGQIGGFVVQAREHVLTLVMFIIMLIGLIFGNFLVKGNESTYETVKGLFENYLSDLDGQTLMSQFLSQSLVNLTFLLLCFVFGLCAIGFPISIITNLVKGISIGALSSFMYSEYTLKGFGYCMLIFYPVQLILSLAMLKTGRESFSMSVSIFKTVTNLSRRQGNEENFKMYLVKFLILLIINLLMSFISALLSVYAVKFFNF